MAVEGVDRGYRANGVLTMIVDPLGEKYPTPESLLQFYDAVEQEIRALPGVRDVGWASTLPLGPSYGGSYFFDIVGEPPRLAVSHLGGEFSLIRRAQNRSAANQQTAQ